MSNYYISKCCKAEVAPDGHFNYWCKKCVKVCEVKAVLDSPGGIPTEDKPNQEVKGDSCGGEKKGCRFGCLCKVCSLCDNTTFIHCGDCVIGKPMTTQKTDFNERVLERFNNQFSPLANYITGHGYAPTMDNIRAFVLSLISQVRADEKTAIKSKIMGMVCDAEIDDLTASKIINKLFLDSVNKISLE